jgi:NADH-quinone oxidoreductase subunit J
MLLNIQAEERRKINLVGIAGGAFVTLAFVVELYLVLQRFDLGKKAFPPLSAENVDDVHNVGMVLFSTHNLPFQVVGVLILVSTIGVIVLSKRELK